MLFAHLIDPLKGAPLSTAARLLVGSIKDPACNSGRDKHSQALGTASSMPHPLQTMPCTAELPICGRTSCVSLSRKLPVNTQQLNRSEECVSQRSGRQHAAVVALSPNALLSDGGAIEACNCDILEPASAEVPADSRAHVII